METEPKFEKISEDKRGANYRVLLPNGQELVLIYTRAGCSRGGHSHDVSEVAMVLTGKMKRISNAFGPGKDKEKVLGPGGVYYNAPGEAHMGTFLEDSWLIDWKIGAKAGEFTTVDYPPFREAVKKR